MATTNHRARHRAIFTLALLLTAPQGWSGDASTRTYVPSKVMAVALPWPKANPVVQLWTVDGDAVPMQILSADASGLRGRRLYSDDGEVKFALDEVAVVYYTRIPLEKFKGTPVALQTWYLPRVAPAGKAEQALDCAAIDVELRRAEALHGLGRSAGSMPLSALEQRHDHEVTAAMGAGAVLLFPFTVSYGAMGAVESAFDRPKPAGPPSPPQPIDDRWGLTKADRRIEGLLDLKQARSCAARPALREPDTDLSLWSEFHRWLASQAPGPGLDLLSRDRRTAVLDALGPRPVMQPAVAEEFAEPGQSAVSHWRDLAWFGGVDALGSLKTIGTLSQHAQRGVLMLTDDAVVAEVGAPGVPIDEVSTRTSIVVRYEDIADVSNTRWGFNRDVVLHRRDGGIDSFQILVGEAAQIHLTVEIGEQIRGRIATWHQLHDAGAPAPSGS